MKHDHFFTRFLGLVFLMPGLLIPGCGGEGPPQESRKTATLPVLKSSGKTENSTGSTAEESRNEILAYQQLTEKYSCPAPDRNRIREWAEAQVRAVRKHLDAFPHTPRIFQLYQWMVTNEIDVLRRYGQAEKALDALEEAARRQNTPEARAATLRAIRLRVRLYARWGKRREELAALERLLPETTGAEKRLMQGRHFELSCLSPGCVMPEFSGKDLWGAPVRGKDSAGRVLLLDFWDLNHPRCDSDFRDLSRACSEYRKLGLDIVGVPLNRSRPAIKKYIRARKVTWPQLFDKRFPGNDHPVARGFNVMSGPTRYLVDRNGVIRYKGLRGSAVLRRIEELLKKSGREQTQ